jgi:4-hydroxy-tetrahydrodipicolinate reductase
MKIAIAGYGRMGKAVEQVAQAMGHEIVAIVDAEHDWAEMKDNLKKADVAIEFSFPEFAADNINKCFDLDLPVATGTTAWESALPRVKARCEAENKSLLVASNFSIGMNILFRLNGFLAGIMDKFDQYAPFIEETHHAKKLDKPSGTAKQLAADLVKKVNRLESWRMSDKAGMNHLPVTSHRINDVPGTHKIRYVSDEDIIEINHTAKSRIGFARGAVYAAHWLVGKTGFYTMDDFMADNI